SGPADIGVCRQSGRTPRDQVLKRIRRQQTSANGLDVNSGRDSRQYLSLDARVPSMRRMRLGSLRTENLPLNSAEVSREGQTGGASHAPRYQANRIAYSQETN